MGGLMSEQPDIAVVASAATSTGAISAEVAVDAYVLAARGARGVLPRHGISAGRPTERPIGARLV
jgi:hypothetical protein